MYLVTGATGNTGKPIAKALLSAGEKVRIISRDKEKAKELTNLGAELIIGDHINTDLLEKALQGATAAYFMIPPGWTIANYYEMQKKYSDSMAMAAQKSKLKHAVVLSSVGAHLNEDSGVIFGLRYLEQKFNTVKDLNIIFLRPTYFMENTLGQIGIIKQSCFMGAPIKGDLEINMIASKDIAEYAAKKLLSLDFSEKKIQYLLGQRNLTYKEVTNVFGNAIGKPDLKYIEFSYEDFRGSLLQMGASEDVANRMITFIKLMNEGKILNDARRDKENTTPTSIEEFAKTFAHLYNSSK